MDRKSTYGVCKFPQILFIVFLLSKIRHTILKAPNKLLLTHTSKSPFWYLVRISDSLIEKHWFIDLLHNLFQILNKFHLESSFFHLIMIISLSLLFFFQYSGVVFYAMATGRLPFQSPRDSQTSSEERRRKLLAQINRGLTPAQKKSISVMSREYRNLVNRLLMPTAHKRITIKELSFHPWISNRQKNSVPKTSQTELLALEHNAVRQLGNLHRNPQTDILESKFRSSTKSLQRQGPRGRWLNATCFSRSMEKSEGCTTSSEICPSKGTINLPSFFFVLFRLFLSHTTQFSSHRAHVIRQGGSFHAFQARSWITATSHPYRYNAQGQNTHATNTSSRYG